MITRLPLILGALCLFPLSCQEEPKSAVESKPQKVGKPVEPAPTDAKKKSLINIPAGAVVSNLTLPYHDKNNRKVSLLTIKNLTVNDKQQSDETLLSGRSLKLWLFDREGAIHTTTTISEANYHVEKELLEAEGKILMIGSENKFAAKSTGGVFSLETGQALLLGPATTRFEIPKKKKTSSP